MSSERCVSHTLSVHNTTDGHAYFMTLRDTDRTTQQCTRLQGSIKCTCLVVSQRVVYRAAVVSPWRVGMVRNSGARHFAGAGSIPVVTIYICEVTMPYR